MLLFWRGQEKTFSKGARIYTEGDACDNTFFLLLSGELTILQRGSVIRSIPDPWLIGQLALTDLPKLRTATVEVGSPKATALVFEVSPEDLKSGVFQALGQRLAKQAWETFVEDSRRL